MCVTCCGSLQVLKPVQKAATLRLCRYMCDELLDQEVMRGLFQERLDGEGNPKGPASKEAATNKRKQKVGGCWRMQQGKSGCSLLEKSEHVLAEEDGLQPCQTDVLPPSKNKRPTHSVAGLQAVWLGGGEAEAFLLKL